jgi:hypothetical protein
LNPGLQGLLELVGGLLLALGLFTRSVAFVLAGDMAVAYFMAHSPRGFFPLLNGGALAIVYCFLFLYFWLAGGGEWSLDRLRALLAQRIDGFRSALATPYSRACQGAGLRCMTYSPGYLARTSMV